MTLGFRRLGEEDLPMLHEWLQREHVKRWWSKHETFENVSEHYLPAILGSDPTQLYVIERDDRAAGFIQTYPVTDYPEYAALTGAGEGVAGVDLFLAEEEQTGRGFGSRVIAEFVRGVVFATPTTTACVADPDADNRASIRAFEKAGFAAIREFQDPHDDNRVHVLMRLERAS